MGDHRVSCRGEQQHSGGRIFRRRPVGREELYGECPSSGPPRTYESGFPAHGQARAPGAEGPREAQRDPERALQVIAPHPPGAPSFQFGRERPPLPDLAPGRALAPDRLFMGSSVWPRRLGEIKRRGPEEPPQSSFRSRKPCNACRIWTRRDARTCRRAPLSSPLPGDCRAVRPQAQVLLLPRPVQLSPGQQSLLFLHGSLASEQAPPPSPPGGLPL